MIKGSNDKIVEQPDSNSKLYGGKKIKGQNAQPNPVQCRLPENTAMGRT